jgi:hypothetical protein
MFRALQYLILIGTTAMLCFYIVVYQPEMVNQLLIKIDVFNITEVAKEEHERIEKIRNLTIPYEEKQVLMNRTVFMQATPDMVKLALGDPKKSFERPWQEHGTMLNYFVYYLGEDKRPTILVFENDKLIQAYKGSALDIANR